MLSAWFLNKVPPHTRHVLWEEFSPYISLIPTNDSLSVSVFSSALESLFLHLFNESFGFSTVFLSPLLLFLSLPRKVFHPSFLDSHVVSRLILVHHMKGGLAAAPPLVLWRWLPLCAAHWASSQCLPTPGIPCWVLDLCHCLLWELRLWFLLFY